MAFSEKLKSRIKEVKGRYPDVESAILPTLHLVQNEYKFISNESITELGRELDLPPAKIYASATFYTMYNLEKIGEYHFQVCRNISCSLLGARKLIDYLSEKLGIKVGQTSSDDKYTLSVVECLGSCGTAPVMMVNDKYYEDLTEEKIDQILQECK